MPIKVRWTPDDFIGPVNTGNPVEFTIEQLADKGIEMTGSASRIIYKPLPTDDPTQRKPDITLARERLGWEPGVALEARLAMTIPYFKQLLGNHGR